MVLKEAYTYQNFLSDLLEKAERYLVQRGFATKTTQTHNRKKVEKDAEDETIIVPKPTEVDFTANGLLAFIDKVLVEKETVSQKISEAKKGLEIDMDSAVALNKKKQGYITVLRRLDQLKASEQDTTATGYRFNSDGNQVPYQYPMREVTTIDFDRNYVKKQIKTLSKECDKTSLMLDQMMLSVEVQHEPLWDTNDSFEDCVAQACPGKKE